MTLAPTTHEHSAADVAEAIGLPHRPTPEQAAVIEAPMGPMLVIAGAGSGKTETMATRVVWLVANGLAEPEDVLGLTFTRKAATELADRISSRLDALRRSGLWTPDSADTDTGAALGSMVTVGTYHSYAGRLVREHGLRLGYETDTRLLSEAAAWQLAHDAVSRYDGPMDSVDKSEATVTAAVIDLAGEMAEHLLTTDEVAAYLQRTIDEIESIEPGATRKRSHPARDALAQLRLRLTILPIVDRYAALKRSREAMDFADQIALAARLVRTFDDVAAFERARCPVVLLDEFQDTSEAQLELLKAVYAGAEGCAVTAVGDPYQSIYGWRGASASTLSRFAHEFGREEPAVVRSLSTSWRGDDAILAVANDVAGPLRAGSHIPVEPLRPRPGSGAGRVEVARLATAADEADHVAQWLAAQRADGPVSAAVLCRKRADFGAVAAALEARGIPHEVVGLGGLLLTPEVEDIIAMLHVVQDPGRSDHLMRVLTGPMMRLGIADLDALASWSKALIAQRRAPAGDAGSRRDLEPDVADRPSLIEALDHLPPADWTPREGPGLSESARGRLEGLAATVRDLRALTYLPLPELVSEVEMALGLDIEVLARPEYTPAAARAHLDAFGDVAAHFAMSADRPTVGGFLDWVAAAIDEERGLDRGYSDASPDAVQIMTVHAAKGLEWDVVAVPALVESTFPAHNLHTSSWREGSWRIGTVKDKGWLGGLRDGGLPYPLRGDRDGLPELRWRGVDGWDELQQRLDEFAAAGGDHALAEERRLFYVAATRARRSLLLTASVWGRPKSPRVTSRFLEEAVAGGSAGGGVVSRGPWANLPVPDDDGKPDKPLDEGGAEFVWPADPFAHRRPRAVAAAAAIGSAAAGAAGGGEESSWEQELTLLLAERAEARARAAAGDMRVELPAHLSTSALIALAGDAEAFAAHVRRPMPSAPAAAARRGTAFHAWIEEHYSRAAIVDLDDIPGNVDVDPHDDGDVSAMRERFLASEWADRVPVEIETALETVIDGVAIRGRVDAVFREVGEAPWVIVDWKSGARPSGAAARVRALQLAAYRIAWSRLRGVPLESVRAAFYYAGSGETVWPDLGDESAISEVLAQVQ